MKFQKHDITVTRSGDTRDGIGRTTATAPDTTIYSGTAELQEQEVTKQTQQGNAVKVAGATAWLPNSKNIVDLGIEHGDNVTVTRPDGSTFDATVGSTKPLDDSLVLFKDRQT